MCLPYYMWKVPFARLLLPFWIFASRMGDELRTTLNLKTRNRSTIMMMLSGIITLTTFSLTTVLLVFVPYFSEELVVAYSAQLPSCNSSAKALIWSLHHFLATGPGLEAAVPASKSSNVAIETALGLANRILQEAIIETCGCHNEVLALLEYAFGP